LAGIVPELRETSGIDKEKFERRFLYASADRRHSFLNEFESQGLLTDTGGTLIASPLLRAYLQHLEDARAEAATAIWDETAAAEASAPIRTVLSAAPPDFRLTADIAGVSEGTTPQHQLFVLLTKLRYMRADAHFAAWSDHGMTASEMVQMTTRWRGQELRPDAGAVATLTEKGLVRGDQLTTEGIRLREVIEEDTNLHNGRALQVLTEAERDGLIARLEALPTVPA
jgi:hypothetical protein